jgi:hypothetical protein
MELTFKTDIGSFLKTESDKRDITNEGWTILNIYDDQEIVIYVKNDFYSKEILRINTKKLTKENIEKINMYFKRGFDTHIIIPNRGRTNISYYDNYINNANKFFLGF